MHQHLLIDADDTLWHNNIYFEQAIHNFIEFLNHSHLTADEIRATLNEIEHQMGYGSLNFIKSLRATYEQLAEHPIQATDLDYIEQLGRQIMEHPLEILDGVQKTLAYLGSRHTLILITKGAQDEQSLKIESSGLSTYFAHTLIVPEKNIETYQQVSEEFSLDPQSTWMIGNSPKSDINPALQAGLNAVYIPYPHTWIMEQQELSHIHNSILLTIETFADLQKHF